MIHPDRHPYPVVMCENFDHCGIIRNHSERIASEEYRTDIVHCSDDRLSALTAGFLSAVMIGLPDGIHADCRADSGTSHVRWQLVKLLINVT